MRRVRGSRAHLTATLCALVIACAMSPAFADDAKPLTAMLLVARADLPDSNFKDSVVLVMNNIGPAPAGVILNRPTRIAVADLFPDAERLAPLTDKLYFGGPVDIATVSFVFRADTPPEHAIRVLDGVYLSTDRTLLRKLLDRAKPMEGLRIFVGYSSWGPGQLEGEIGRGDWKLAPADMEALFGSRAEHPWPGGDTPDSAHRTCASSPP
ncbi:MAG TPA: YqgE/AlgH family protein, partial [Casimicrobiaceae bacterium]|nr:YqgE/AlgH family protein [Casimicrobiaceae bacterium]